MFYGKELFLLFPPEKGRRGRPRHDPDSVCSEGDTRLAWLNQYPEKLRSNGDSALAWYFQAAVRRECAMSWIERDEEPGSSATREKVRLLGQLIERDAIVTLGSMKEHGPALASFRELAWFYDGARYQSASSVTPMTKQDLKFATFWYPFFEGDGRRSRKKNSSREPIELFETQEFRYFRMRRLTSREQLQEDFNQFIGISERAWPIDPDSLRQHGVLPYIDLLFWERRHEKSVLPDVKAKLIYSSLYGTSKLRVGPREIKEFSYRDLDSTVDNADAFLDMNGMPAQWLQEQARRELILAWRKTKGKGDGQFVDYEHRYLNKHFDY